MPPQYLCGGGGGGGGGVSEDLSLFSGEQGNTCTYRMLANKPHKFHPTITVGGYRADGAYKVRFNVVAMLVF